MEKERNIKFESFLDLVNDRYKAICLKKGIKTSDINKLDKDQLKVILGILGILVKRNIGVEK